MTLKGDKHNNYDMYNMLQCQILHQSGVLYTFIFTVHCCFVCMKYIALGERVLWQMLYFPLDSHHSHVGLFADMQNLLTFSTQFNLIFISFNHKGNEALNNPLPKSKHFILLQCMYIHSTWLRSFKTCRYE